MALSRLTVFADNNSLTWVAINSDDPKDYEVKEILEWDTQFSISFYNPKRNITVNKANLLYWDTLRD